MKRRADLPRIADHVRAVRLSDVALADRFAPPVAP